MPEPAQGIESHGRSRDAFRDWTSGLRTLVHRLTSSVPASSSDISAASVCLWAGALYLLFALTAVLFPAFDAAVMQSELGVIESLQVAILASVACLAVAMARAPGAARIYGLRPWLWLIAACAAFMVGEETSWGQHYIGWRTPAWLADLNDQGETNIHNIGSWLDQKPRSLLLLAVVLGGVVHPLLAHWRGKGLIAGPWWLLPTLAALPPASLAFVAGLPKQIDQLTGTALSFGRPSELEELFFYATALVYLVSLSRRALGWTWQIARRRAWRASLARAEGGR